MLKLPRTAYDWALRHLITEGDTDLFPTPFEIAAIKHLWKTLGPQFANTDLSSYVWRGGRRFVVPKSILSFRVATQLEEDDEARGPQDDPEAGSASGGSDPDLLS